jgi:hypothetical protein
MTKKQEQEVDRIIKETIELAYHYLRKHWGMSKTEARNYAERYRPSRFDVTNQVLGIRFPVVHRSQWCHLYPHC